MMTWFTAAKHRRLIGGRKDDVRIDGVTRRWPRYVRSWLDGLPGWAIVSVYLSAPFAVFVLGFLLVWAPITALSRVMSNQVTDGFRTEYHNAIFGWNYYMVEGMNHYCPKGVRLSGLSAELASMRFTSAFPRCDYFTFEKVCGLSRRHWLSRFTCTPEKFHFETRYEYQSGK